MENKCSSCGKSVTNDTRSTSFPCPSCTNVTIIRCKQCRSIGVGYTCPKCKFEGP